MDVITASGRRHLCLARIVLPEANHQRSALWRHASESETSRYEVWVDCRECSCRIASAHGDKNFIHGVHLVLECLCVLRSHDEDAPRACCVGRRQPFQQAIIDIGLAWQREMVCGVAPGDALVGNIVRDDKIRPATQADNELLVHRPVVIVVCGVGPDEVRPPSCGCSKPRPEDSKRFIAEHASFDLYTSGGEHCGAPVASRRWVDDTDSDSGDASVDQLLAARRRNTNVIARFERDDGRTATCRDPCRRKRVYLGVRLSFASVEARTRDRSVPVKDDTSNGRIRARRAQSQGR